ncbi:NADH dehydrogenase subunit L [Mucilaginibacter yixingensis]|uniref:NADH dehydrogenase subunit L n=1 Tax=Mucilaginibacter yixingensis TaxID=1295612 RepID=A0A2T5JEZ5_9SPHI|nr:NADH-quinone oxidoreductase subunit L [Mucilaginibacter yixingensis]PTR00989.1 NADH dehydrogenase subunit L [Mucilaginibacter yixingensis]
MVTALSPANTQLIYLALGAVVMPFAAFLINFLLLGKGSKAAGWVSVLAIVLSCVCAISLFSKVWNGPEIHIKTIWFTIGETNVYAGLWLNNLSAVMLALVTLIAVPVHIYGTAYMKGEPNYGRYFTYLSFFCFSMLALVVVDNLVLLYGFWELVGFSSYLLIGFWNTRDKAVQANKKAFIINRIGDIGLLVGILIIFVQFRTFDMTELFRQNGLISQSLMQGGVWVFHTAAMPAVWQYVAAVGIIMAVAAKSAQFPLHTWLPDAMEGPTSVSALIHAATMVAAGVFLLGRVYPLFNTYELNALAIIGCFTAFMAATIALTQDDLKRVLAYSTISQLGFMVLAMGIGAYSSSLFHLITHAFFKCLLFLCAGVIIHEMQHIKDEYDLDIDPQNLLYMGGLRKKMPLTFVVFTIAAGALVGLPFTSGYLSKDGIIVQAFEWAAGKEGYFMLIPVFALISGALTAFYVARLFFKVFFGELEIVRINPHIKPHISDGGWAYKGPLVFLAACCLFPVFSGNPFLYEDAWLMKGLGEAVHMERMNIYHTIVPVAVTVFSVFLIYWAYAVYIQQRKLVFPQHNPLFRFSYNEWYIDRFYRRAVVAPVLALGGGLYGVDRNVIDGFIGLLQKLILSLADVTAWIDKHLIDGFLHLLAFLVRSIGNFARSFQNGRVQYYLLSMLAVIAAFFIYKILM